MAVSMLDNISYLGRKNDTVRSQFNTIEEMKNFNPNYLSDMYISCCLEDGCVYVYNISNPETAETGKWKKIGSDGSADLIDYFTKFEVQALLENYVEKEVGKGLSTNDYTTLEREKLASLENYDDTGIQTHVSTSEKAIADIQTAMGNAVLNTTAQTLNEAVNEIKTNCDAATSSISKRVTNNEESIAVLNGDTTVSGSVAKKVATCLIDAKSYTDQKIEEMASTQAIVCDEKPSYMAGITTYIKDGIPETTDEENIWFYYTLNGQLMQTIWISKEEITIVSAGGVDFNDLVSKTKDVVSTYSGDEADTSKVPDLGAMKNLETKLQTSIDLKIGGDAIYDGIDSTSITSALSANQGRVLNESVNAKLDKVFAGDGVANKNLVTDSFGNVVLGTYDEALDATSSNAVQNKAIKAEVDKKLDIVQDVGKAGYVAVIGEDGNMTFSEPTTLGGKAEVVAYENDEYPDLTNVDLALDKILAKIYYEPLKITSFTCNVADTHEIGTALTDVVFSWSYSKEIKSQALTDCTIVIDDRETTYANLSATKTFVLTSSDGSGNEGGIAVASKKISFLYPIYYGCCAEVEEYNNDFVLALENKTLVSSNKMSYNFNCGSGEYAYFAAPTSMKVTSAWVNGFQSSVEEVAVVSHTNASGYVSPYTISRFSNSGLGSFVAEVR